MLEDVTVYRRAGTRRRRRWRRRGGARVGRRAPATWSMCTGLKSENGGRAIALRVSCSVSFFLFTFFSSHPHDT